MLVILKPGIVVLMIPSTPLCSSLYFHILQEYLWIFLGFLSAHGKLYTVHCTFYTLHQIRIIIHNNNSTIWIIVSLERIIKAPLRRIGFGMRYDINLHQYFVDFSEIFRWITIIIINSQRCEFEERTRTHFSSVTETECRYSWLHNVHKGTQNAAFDDVTNVERNL